MFLDRFGFVRNAAQTATSILGITLAFSIVPGAFVGLACQDLAGTARPADFDWFEYRERPYLNLPAR